MKLAEIQARFYELVTARETVAATLAARGEAARRAVEEMVAGDARLPAAARLEIYADMYFARIHDVLREELPRTAAVLGAAEFHALVTDYLQACRPRDPSLREAGARLPAFLAAHALAAGRPWLAELARLERTRLELHDGPDAEALSLATLRTLAPEEFGALRLRLIPCHALLQNAHDLTDLWRRAEHEDGPPPAPAPTALIVWRPDLEVFHRAAEPEEAAWLRRLGAETATLEALCGELAAGRSDQAAAARAFELVGRWAGDGLLLAGA